MGRMTEKEVGGMVDSVYKFIELVGTSEESWEKAAARAVELHVGLFPLRSCVPSAHLFIPPCVRLTRRC